MDYRTIRVTEADGIAEIRLDRPEVMNALDAQMRAEIAHALREAGGRARVIVLTGTGRAFCAGQDLGEGHVAAPDLERTLRDEYLPMIRLIVEAPVPVIAAVNGAAAGAGANLALACDVVIASEAAVFVQAFTRIGLMPDAGGTWLLPRQIGLPRAMGAMLFADPVPARQAADWGMIYEAVPEEAFEAHWRARAARLAAGPTRAYAELKAALRGAFATDLEAQMLAEAQAQGRLGQTRDFREGVVAFLAKRAAAFEGR